MKLAGHTIHRVAPTDAARVAAVQALFALDPHYFLHDEGAPLRADEAAIVLDERPPGIPLAAKHAFLVDDLAFLDLLAGYPEPATWFLGLVFLAPAARGRGLGTALVEAVCAHAKAEGARALRLAVAHTNTGARRLYERLGFAFVDDRKRPVYTGAVVDLAVLERVL